MIDLDGVVWLAGQPIPGAAEAVSRLRKAGEQVLFLTNNSSLTIEEYHRRLGRAGITVEAGEVLTSAQAAASLLAPGSTALACGGPGVWEALEAQGVAAVARGPADAVVVGWDRSFDFDRLAAATTCVLGGARLVGTNGDPTYPTPDGPLPGAGALLAAVACATATTPVVAGKPYEPVAALLRERLG
ncbi:MAG TPA: hypothetical protein VE152_04095, partial [Acidimicrobiales bacterium]|nr:hypothetical protein [Acidimicrobiales bacterium]